MRLAIVHFQPIEYYPPACNLLNYLNSNNSIQKCHVFTSHGIKNKSKYSGKSISIKRCFSIEKSGISIIRLLGYYYFNLFTFIGLILLKPSVVVYFESYSAMPVYWYFRWFGKSSKLWIHSHEYFSKEWYETGMKTVRHYHTKETTFLYKRAFGLSQTNSFRNKLFLTDYPEIDPSKMYVMPNYPSLNWGNFKSNINTITLPLKTVYIGSLSLRSTYIENYCNWVVSQNGNVLLDIYSNNADNETIYFIQGLNCHYIRFFNQGIPNDEIPDRICKEKYSAGLILYKDGPANTVWCASNKLFEYLVCGLDVWFTSDMSGTYPYITENSYPKVLKVDFSDMTNFDLPEAINHKDYEYKPFNYNYEAVYNDFIKQLQI